jgi:uncharacterized protein with PIN domain
LPLRLPNGRLPPPRLLIDLSLGRLERWLRVIGVDAESRVGLGAEAWAAANRPPGAPATPLSTPELLRWANESRRVVVTKDGAVMKAREGCAALWVTSNVCAEQFSSVCNALAIRFTPASLMARCSACNSEGYEVLGAEEVRRRDAHLPESKRVPEKVLAFVPRFFGCTLCKKIYWEGVKYNQALTKYNTLFAAAAPLGEQPPEEQPPLFYKLSHSELVAPLTRLFLQ